MQAASLRTIPTTDPTLWDPEKFVYTVDERGDITEKAEPGALSHIALGRTIASLVKCKDHCTQATVSAAKLERVLDLVEVVYTKFTARLGIFEFTAPEKKNLKIVRETLRAAVEEKDRRAKEALTALLYPNTLIGYVNSDDFARQQQTIVEDLRVDHRTHIQIGVHYCLASTTQRLKPPFVEAKAIYIKHFSTFLVRQFAMQSAAMQSAWGSILTIDPEFQWMRSFIENNPSDECVTKTLSELQETLELTSVTSKTRLLFDTLMEQYGVLSQLQTRVPNSHVLHAASLFLFLCDETDDSLLAFAKKNPSDELVHVTLQSLVMKTRYKEISTLQTRELVSILIRMYFALQKKCSQTSKASLLDICSVFVQGGKSDAKSDAKIDAFGPVATKIFEMIPDKDNAFVVLVDYLLLVAELALSNNRYRGLVESGTAYMLQFDASLFKEIMQKAQGDMLEPIICAFTKTDVSNSFASMLLKRYEQLIKHRASLFSKLQSVDIFRLAYFIEAVVLSQYSFTSFFYKNKPSILPRSIQSDAISGACSILLKHKLDMPFRKEGFMKKVTHSLFVPMDAGKEAFCAGRVVSKDTVSTFTHAQIYAIMERELFVYQFLGNFRGIWPLLSWCRYEKTKERVTFPKLSLILKLADSDLEGFSFSHSKLDRFLGYMEDLAYGLWYMHEKGFVHIDAKATNALVGGDCAGWIDFGHCFRPKEEPLPEKNPLRLGFYGTNIYTAYELLGKRGFSGDYTKLDVWAFGCMFYGILKGTFLPWTNLLLPLEPHSVVSCELREKMKEEITKTIERPLGRLQQKNPQTLQIPDLLELLVYNMLRLDPNVRWSMKEVVEQIAIIRRLIR